MKGPDRTAFRPLLPLGRTSSLNGRLVLIADDDEPMRDLIAGVLQREGFRTESAADGLELIAYFERANLPKPDIILTDGQMPRCTGYGVLAALHRMGIRTPVIFMTAFGDPESDAMAQRLGASAILHKPFDIYELRQLTRRLLSLRSRGDSKTRIA
jgi:CheY-like chemotaxis protein